MFEWFLIGHYPWTSALQYVMFVYWAGVFTAPMIFIDPLDSRVRKPFFLFFASTSLMMIVGTWGLKLWGADPMMQLIFIVLSWSLAFTVFIGFLLWSIEITFSFRWLFLIAIVAPIVEAATPYPLDFIAFSLWMAACGMWLYRKVRKKALLAT